MPEGTAAAGSGSGRAKRSRLGRSLGAVGLVLVIVIGVFVVRGVRGTSAGASSPDDLVEQLEAAMTNTDPAAALALIDPAEIPQLGAFYQTAVEQAAAGADVDVPAVLEALTLTVEGVEFHVEYLDDDHTFAKVVFDGGRVAYETHPDRLPPAMKERFGDDDLASEPESGSGDVDQLQITTDDGRTIEPFLVLVNDDGRWYVSLTMTAGQYAVEVADLPGGNFENYPEPGDPASSPEDAVRQLLDASFEAANTGAYEGAPLDGLFPDAQTRAFRIYGDAIAAAMERSADDTYDDEFAFDGLEAECEGCGITYSDLEVATRTHGSLTYAVIESLTIQVKVPDSCFVGGSYAFDHDYAYDDEYALEDDLFADESDDGVPDGSVPDDGAPDPDDRFAEVIPPSYDPGDGSGANLPPSDVVPSSLHAPGEDPEEDCGTVTGTIDWDGSCVTIHEESTGDAFAIDPDEFSDDEACLDDELGESGLTLADFGITDVHLVVSEERGGWVLDPVATVMDYGRTALSHLSDPKVKAALDD